MKSPAVIQQEHGERWALYNADTVEVARSLPDASVDFSIFSPPFASLYTYSNSPRDMGNVRSYAEFFENYGYLVREQRRVMAPGRLVAFHCMLLPTSKERDGHIGLRDFRGDLIRAYTAEGFIYHSEVCIWKDPVTAMQRTKALGLLHKTIRKDSSMSRQGIADYLVVMRSPGANEKPIEHTHDEFPVERWQRYASPVWAHPQAGAHKIGERNYAMDEEGFLTLDDTQVHGDDSSGVDATDTLQYRSAREHDDERHICPLQLAVIRRAVRLWSRKEDVVWSPFAGIGSEGYVALEEGRRFVGAELKASYYRQAVLNLREAAMGTKRQPGLFESVA
jgi:hypothetical protein